ncbi:MULTISPECIES: hypothetical protein [Mesorhizobium]|uniref:hypothetical protein n=1 Tax=Mesorhizobium TaxID=68287 RepID=UPI0011410B14|nr:MULTISPECIES: hypothetical protein [Mesorhizobium]
MKRLIVAVLALATASHYAHAQDAARPEVVVVVPEEVQQADRDKIKDIITKSFDFGVQVGPLGGGIGISIKSADQQNKSIDLSRFSQMTPQEVQKNFLCDALCDTAAAGAAAACSGLSAGVAVAACLAAAAAGRDECHRHC